MANSEILQKKCVKFPCDILPFFKNKKFGFKYLLQNMICNFVFDFILTEQNVNVYSYSFSDFEKKYLLTKTDDELAKILSPFEFSFCFDFPLGLSRKIYSGIFNLKFYTDTASKIENFKLNFEFNLSFSQKKGFLNSKEFPFIARFDYKIMTNYFLEKIDEFMEIRESNLSRECISVDLDLIKSVSVECFDNYNLSLAELEVLLIIFHIYKEKVKYSSKRGIIFSVDDILKIKNTPIAKNSNGFCGGYQEFYRKNIDKIIFKLENLRNEYEDKYFYISRYLNSDKGKSKYYYYLKPTDIFLELINSKKYEIFYNSLIFTYHHNINYYEKFLGLFFSQNCKLSKIYVEDLILKMFNRQEVKRPNIVREKFENALDVLVDDGIISAWEYKNIDEEKLQKKYWFEDWLKIELKVLKNLA